MPWPQFFLWFALVWSAGWLFFPFSRRIFGDTLPDGGLAAGRVIALAVWTMSAFWAGHLGLSTDHCVFIGLLLGLMGLVALLRRKRDIEADVRRRRRAIWASETVFVLVFAAFFVLRGFWSDTSGTNGEKAMDSALIGSLVRAQRLPAPNPYAAGAELRSYYYLGHLQTALLSCATRAPVRWTYNWECATLPALCFSTLFSLGAALTRRLRGGFFVTASVLGLGTLQPIYQWTHPGHFGASAPFHLDFFAVSRVIPYTINEFPFFTFNQSDLHAHYFAMPLALATLCLALALFRGQKAAMWPAMLILGAQIGTNTWDFPAYALVLAMAVMARESPGAAREAAVEAEIAARQQLPAERKNRIENEIAARRQPSDLRPKIAPTADIEAKIATATAAPTPFSERELLARIGAVGVIWGGALLLTAPYLLGIKTAASPPHRLEFPASPLREWGLLWGVFAAAWLAFLAYGHEGRGARAFFAVFGAMFLLYTRLVPWETPDRMVLPLIVCLLLFSVYGAWRTRGAARFLCFLAVAGLLALAWSETTWAGFLGSADHPGFDDFKRQDTVFKFGLQTWMLWGIAAASGAVLSFSKWPRALQIAIMPALGVMAMASVAAVFGRARGFEKWDGWDGWAHLAPGEVAAASWLEQHAAPGQNLIEAEQIEGGDYSPYSRYASATGIPSVVGPQAHTFQWSPANSGDAGKEWAEVARRKAAARAIYHDFRGEKRRAALRDFGVRFLIFGELERDQYGESALQSLQNDPLFTPVAHFDDAPPRLGDWPASPDAKSHEVWIFKAK